MLEYNICLSGMKQLTYLDIHIEPMFRFSLLDDDGVVYLKASSI